MNEYTIIFILSFFIVVCVEKSQTKQDEDTQREKL